MRIQGFDDQKLKKGTAEKKYIFYKKNCNYVSLGLLVRPGKRTNLPPSKKKNIQHFQILNFIPLYVFFGNFCPPGSGSSKPKSMRIPENLDPEHWFKGKKIHKKIIKD
jgi:hypothetical protein